MASKIFNSITSRLYKDENGLNFSVSETQGSPDLNYIQHIRDTQLDMFIKEKLAQYARFIRETRPHICPFCFDENLKISLDILCLKCSEEVCKKCSIKLNIEAKEKDSVCENVIFYICQPCWSKEVYELNKETT